MSLHRTWIEISREALRENIRNIRSVLQPGVTFCAVVKAQAYGHGIAPVVSVCKEEGIDHFAVDAIGEAEEVRACAGKDATIFLMGAQLPIDYERVLRVGGIQTVSSPEEIQTLAQEARRLNIPAQISFEIETGLHRLGAQERSAKAMLREAQRHQGYVFVQSVSSHFARSEETAAQWETKRQHTIFCDAIRWLEESHVHPPYQHIACSAATLTEPNMRHTLVRVGIMLYGLWSSADTRRQGAFGKHHVQLLPVLSLKTHLVHVQDIASGSAVGYGGSFVANHPMRIGVLPLGYYDGLDRRAGNGEGFVLIRGTRCPILGKICMNMCMVDLGGAPALTRVGDVVTLIGRDGVGTLSSDEWAQAWGTIHYEVVTRLAAHLPRILV